MSGTGTGLGQAFDEDPAERAVTEDAALAHVDATVTAVAEILAFSKEPAVVVDRALEVRWANTAFWALPWLDAASGPLALSSVLPSPLFGQLLRRVRAVIAGEQVAHDLDLDLTSTPYQGGEVVVHLTPLPSPAHYVVCQLAGASNDADEAMRARRLEATLRRIREELGSLAFAFESGDEAAGDEAAHHLPATMSRRSREVAALLIAGHTVDAIAGELGLSPHTVHNHVKAAFRQLGVHSVAELMGKYRP